jgi:hypothetical protein
LKPFVSQGPGIDLDADDSKLIACSPDVVSGMVNVGTAGKRNAE